MSKRVKVKPGKGQSMAGFFGGLLFCFLGLFVVIPTFGAFGIIWTIFAVIITIVNGMNAFTDKGVASHEIIVDEDNYTAYDSLNGIEKDTDGGKDATTRLNELQSLYDQALITSEEYDKKRQQILDEI